MANPMAGNAAGASATADKEIFWNLQHVPKFVQGVIDATYCALSKLAAGTLMAQLTTSRRWIPLKYSLAAGAGEDATALIVDNAALFKAGDVIKIGSTAAVIDSINYDTNTITLTAAKTWSDNAIITTDTALAGGEIARAVLAEDIDLYDPNTLDVRDMATGKLCFDGCIKTSAIVGDLAAVRAATTHKLDSIQWDDDTGYKA